MKIIGKNLKILSLKRRRLNAKEKDTNWSVIDYLHYSNNADRFGALCVGSVRKVTQKAVTENFQNFVKLDEFLDFANAIRTGEEIKKINLALAQTTSLASTVADAQPYAHDDVAFVFVFYLP